MRVGPIFSGKKWEPSLGKTREQKKEKETLKKLKKKTTTFLCDLNKLPLL